MAKQMRGVFAIPPTPFTSAGDVDEPGLRNVIRFCVKARVHGIVAPVNASEFTSLSDDERKRVVEIAVDETAGAVPVVAGVTGTCVQHAVIFARHAREVGADAVIAMPPHVRKASSDEIVEYYRSIASAAARPVFIQNHIPPVGTTMSPEFLARLVREIEWVDYIKEECWPPGHFISAALARCGSKLKGIMGGMAGRYLLDEARRGACGTMPACEIAEVHVALWERIEAQDWPGARDIFNAMLPLLNMEFMYGVSVYKEVLRRRGIISSTYMRPAGHLALDEFDRKELDEILEGLTPLFRV